MADVLIPMAVGSHIDVGFYAGNGAASRVITLGYTPKIVMVFEQTCTRLEYYNNAVVAHLIASVTTPAIRNEKTYMEVVSGGFKVYQDTDGEMVQRNVNAAEHTYFYIVMR